MKKEKGREPFSVITVRLLLRWDTSKLFILQYETNWHCGISYNLNYAEFLSTEEWNCLILCKRITIYIIVFLQPCIKISCNLKLCTPFNFYGHLYIYSLLIYGWSLIYSIAFVVKYILSTYLDRIIITFKKIKAIILNVHICTRIIQSHMHTNTLITLVLPPLSTAMYSRIFTLFD